MAIIIESYGLHFNTLSSVKSLVATDDIVDVAFDPQRDILWELSDEIRNNTKDLIISYNGNTSTRLRVRNSLDLSDIRARLMNASNKVSYDVIGVNTDFLNLA